MSALHDPRICALGEGPLWHPERGQLFWFDILGKRLLTQGAEWAFDDHVSAAGWIGRDHLLIASQRALFRFDLTDGTQSPVAPLEPDNKVTRSNDGRADPWGGFWIGTMGFHAEPGAGAIYRFYRGKVTRLFGGITISNAICFAPDRRHAYFTDTPTGQVMRQALDEEGWPRGAPARLIDLRPEGLNPDGAVVDRDGCLWIAQWGASRVARYSPEGDFLSAISFPASQISCPAFGGAGLSTLFATSAACDLPAPGPVDGATFVAPAGVVGQAEYRVIL